MSANSVTKIRAARLDLCDSESDNTQLGRLVRTGPVGFGDRTMTQSKNSDELYNEQRRQRAAELIAAIVRKRRRMTTDESLLDQEALRAAAERARPAELNSRIEPSALGRVARPSRSERFRTRAGR